MRFLIITLCFTAILFISVANGQTWTSPDDVISVTPPDSSQFHELPNPPPPFLVVWVSNDESMKFGIIKVDVPRRFKLIQSSVEEGLAEEFGGTVTRLPTKTIAGHNVLCMTTKGPSTTITQSVIHHGNVVYKVMAVTIGDVDLRAVVNQFIDSISVSENVTSPNEGSVVENGNGFDLHQLSKAVGGAGALILIGVVTYLLTRRKTPTRN